MIVHNSGAPLLPRPNTAKECICFWFTLRGPQTELQTLSPKLRTRSSQIACKQTDLLTNGDFWFEWLFGQPQKVIVESSFEQNKPHIRNFPPVIPGPEMAAPILWAPGIFWFFLLDNPHAHKIPLFRGGVLGFFRKGGWKCQFYFYGRGDFSDLSHFHCIGTWGVAAAWNRCHLSNWRFNPVTVHILAPKQKALSAGFWQLSCFTDVGVQMLQNTAFGSI